MKKNTVQQPEYKEAWNESKDRNWSREVRQRDKNRCRYFLKNCTGKATEASHIFPRGIQSTRWNLINGLAACRSCHRWIEDNPAKAREIHQKLIGEKEYQQLEEMSRRV